MKKSILYILFVMISLFLTSSCSKTDTNINKDMAGTDIVQKDSGQADPSEIDKGMIIEIPGSEDGTVTNDDAAEDDAAIDDAISEKTFEAEVIEVDEALLVAPAPDSDEYKSSDRISVWINNPEITDADGNYITLSDIKTGDHLRITYDGTIAESYPAQITAQAIQVIGHNILLDGYLAVIDKIYQEDDGLNGDITMIALDTTGWTDISALDKEIIFTKMKESYGLEIKEGTSEELGEQGIIDKEKLYFLNGVHIIISNVKYNDKKTKISCSVQKWRGGDGAIGSDDTTAKYKDGEWSVSFDSMWIS